MSKDCQDGGIVFGDWKLFPVDSMNWELCHRHAVGDTHAARKAGTVGVVQWNRLGRFYQYNTIPNAIKYAADCEVKNECHKTVMELWDALAEYNRITEALKADVLAALGGAR